MLWCYDRAIAKDLEKSFNPDNVEVPPVRVIGSEGMINLVAQLQNDKISLPIVGLTREPEKIDNSRTNFSKLHNGVAAVFDNDTNNMYYEKCIPVKLSYNLTVLTNNEVDLDEILRELMFKYSQEYFISFRLPYECNRKVRFGVIIDPDAKVERTSGSLQYLQSGQLHQGVLHLLCEGCVLVTYTPAHLLRVVNEAEVEIDS